MRPVVVCPDINSPAQSFASVIKVPSNSCLPCRLALFSFCFGSFGDSSGSFRQHKNAKARHSNTIKRPAKNVNMLDSKKHHHFLPFRHSSSSNASVLYPSVPDVNGTGDIVCDIPYNHQRANRHTRLGFCDYAFLLRAQNTFSAVVNHMKAK